MATETSTEKTFSYVRLMREIRDRHNEETKDMSWEEYRQWLHSGPEPDPLLADWFDRVKRNGAKRPSAPTVDGE